MLINNDGFYRHNDKVRKMFEDAKDGQTAFDLKLHFEATIGLPETWGDVGDGLGQLLERSKDCDFSKLDATHAKQTPINKWLAMEIALRAKFAMPEFRQILLQTKQYILLEHNEVQGRDTIWSDDRFGDGENRLGRMLMLLRKELLPNSWPKLLVK